MVILSLTSDYSQATCLPPTDHCDDLSRIIDIVRSANPPLLWSRIGCVPQTGAEGWINHGEMACHPRLVGRATSGACLRVAEITRGSVLETGALRIHAGHKAGASSLLPLKGLGSDETVGAYHWLRDSKLASEINGRRYRL